MAAWVKFHADHNAIQTRGNLAGKEILTRLSSNHNDGTNPMALLEVDNLVLSFAGLHVIKDLSFTVEEGSIASLIGPNGAGKTSVFNCLTGFFQI